MKHKQTEQELRRLYRILDAGEAGYAVSAVNVNNRGLKVLLKSFAQQRIMFKAEVRAELQQLGSEANTRSGLLSAIHRGRINIFAALTISQDDREQAVLKEILTGERFALNAYKQALKKDLLTEVRKLLELQMEEVQQVIEQLSLMRGREGKRLVIRLFETESDAEKALADMKNAGLHPDKVEHLDFRGNIDIYEGKTTTVTETIISGAVGGALWGGLIGVLAGVGIHTAGLAPFDAVVSQNIWTYLPLAGIFAGEFVGSILGFAIGVGISGEDSYQYEMSLKRGKVLLIAIVDAIRASEAGKIMSLVNLKAREESTA